MRIAYCVLRIAYCVLRVAWNVIREQFSVLCVLCDSLWLIPLLRGPCRRGDDGAGYGGASEFFEAKFEAELFHNRQSEIRFLRRRELDVAIGFVNADELRAFLELFFGHWMVEG